MIFAAYIPGSECEWNNPVGSIRGNVWGSDDSSCTATIISFLAVYKSGVSITLLDLQPLCYCWLCFGRYHGFLDLGKLIFYVDISIFLVQTHSRGHYSIFLFICLVVVIPLRSLWCLLDF